MYQVDYHEDFRLFLVTRNAAPLLPPDTRPLLTITNFTITRSGLEGEQKNVFFSQHITNLPA